MEDSPDSRRSELATVLGVGAGGAVGATARWLVGEAMNPTAIADGGFPWATLLVNVVGCLLVGAAAGRLRRSEFVHAVVVTGVLGGFTTMSAVAVELNDLADESRPGAAAAYLAVTLAGGLIALVLGSRLTGVPTDEPQAGAP